MQTSDSPNKVPLPFANSGLKVAIPATSQIGIVDGAASYPDGFPPLTMTPPGSGGVPPNGQEMNGILFALSGGLRWLQGGNFSKFDSAFSTAVGGYPIGAVLRMANNAGWWRSLAEDNGTDPDAGGANWEPHFASGSEAVTLTGSNVTLTAVQAARPMLFLSGVLTANVNLYVPTTVQTWLIFNNTLPGAYGVTVRPVSGTGVLLDQGSSIVFGDGINVRLVASSEAIPVRGTFVPDVKFGGSNTGITYSSRRGEWYRTGKKIDFSFELYCTSLGSATGDATVTLTGLPVAYRNFPQQISIDLMSFTEHPSGLIPGGTNLMEIRTFDGVGSDGGSATHANFTATGVIYCTGWYLTA